MQRHKAHAPGTVTGKALYGHIGHNITSVFDVGRFAERRVGAAHVMMVASQHNGAHLAASHHFVEAQSYLHAALGILIEDTCLRAHHQIVFLGIANPIVIIQVLPAPGGINALHRRTVGLHQVFVLAA